jgi:hypothetical protein
MVLEVAMILAAFLAIVAAQKHADCRLPEVRCRGKDLVSTLPFFQRATMKTHGLTTKIRAKKPKNVATAKVGLASVVPLYRMYRKN